MDKELVREELEAINIASPLLRKKPVPDCPKLVPIELSGMIKSENFPAPVENKRVSEKSPSPEASFYLDPVAEEVPVDE